MQQQPSLTSTWREVSSHASLTRTAPAPVAGRRSTKLLPGFQATAVWSAALRTTYLYSSSPPPLLLAGEGGGRQVESVRKQFASRGVGREEV